MLRKYFPFPAVLVLAALLLAITGWYWLRPVRILDRGQNTQVQARVWTVAQALRASKIELAQGDQVEPGLNALLPLNGQIRIRRALHALVWEDGQAQMAAGLGPSAFDLLEQNDITLGPQDRLLVNGKPATGQALSQDGQALILQIIRARTIQLDIDGQRREVSTTAVSAARVLWDAGVPLGPGGLVSVAPDQIINEDMSIAYQPARALDIQIGDQVISVYSAAATVGEALAEARIALQGMDYSQPAEGEPIPHDGKIRVVRVREEIILNQTPLPYETVYQTDSALDANTERTTREGQYGVKAERTRARFENGEEISRSVDSDSTAAEPVAKTIARGPQVVAGAGASADGIQYWKAVQVYATSYSPCQQGTGSCSWGTSSGMRLTKGVIGVTSAWYRLLAGQQVFIPGYGYGVIGDIGGGIPGKPWIDLAWDEENYQPMGGWMTMYLIAPVPEDPDSFTLP